MNYTLQIAVDKSYATGSIVLEKTGLATSKYTLNENEELRFGGSNTPFYWRIKAIDAALNESEWTVTSEFSIKSASSTAWLWVIVVVILVVLAVVLWVILRKCGVRERPKKAGTKPNVRARPEQAIAAPITPPSSKEKKNYAANVVCSKCGGANRPNAGFCAHCGASLEVAITCPKCSFFNRAGATFCSRCGKSLREGQ